MNVKTLILILFFSFFIFLLKAEENLTITAYYPSPYASYNALQLYPDSYVQYNHTCNETTIGTFYYNNTDTTKGILYCDGTNWHIEEDVWEKDDGHSYYYNNQTRGTKVGIGTSEPYALLTVKFNRNDPYPAFFIGERQISGEITPIFNITSSSKVIFGNTTGIRLPDEDYIFYIYNSRYNNTSNHHGLYIRGDLTVNGTIYCTNCTICPSSSDIRLKKNLENLTNVIDKLKDIQPVRFEWRKEEFPQKNLPSGKQIGLIAQEVEKYFPELVSADSQGYKNIDYQRFVAVLLAGIKEQIKEVERLEKLEKAREKKKMSFN